MRIMNMFHVNAFSGVIILLLSMTACSSNQQASSDTGSISFKLQLSRPTTTSRAAAATSADICTDYGIMTINANVANSSGAEVAAMDWPCSAHQGTIEDVPAGTDYTIRITGTATGGTIAWRGEKSGVSVTAGEITTAGAIIMTYTGNDITLPAITSTSPSSEVTGVPVTSMITATFSEKIAASSINTTSFTVKGGTTPVSGSVVYDTATRRAVFLPSTNLAYTSSYIATLTTDIEDMAGNNMESDYSWSFTTEDTPAAEPPAAPTGLIAVSGNGQNIITWDAVQAATSYNIYWSTTSGVTKTTGTKISDISTNSYTHTGLANGTTYHYIVTSINSYGESIESNEISSAPGSIDTNPPTGSITINNNSVYTTTTSVTLSLSSSSSRGVSQMCISNTTTCSLWEPYTTSKSWTLTTGDGLRFVYAWFKDSTGTSNTSPYLAAITLDTTPPTDGTLTATAGNEQVSLSWNGFSDVTSGIGGYKLVYSSISTPDTCSSGTQVYSGSDTSYTHTSLTNDTTYYYRVCAIDNVGNVSAGSSGSVIPNPPARLPKTGQTISYATGDDGDLQRGVAWPSPRFTDNGNDTITDNLTGIIWTKDGNAGIVTCPPAIPKTWQDALDYVTCLNNNSYLGYTDWRLPNINDLRSLVNAGEADIGTWLTTRGFNNVKGYYWSSTSYVNSTYNKRSLKMDDGGEGSTNSYVWPVRPGGTSVIFLPKTGQTACYDLYGSIPCGGTGQDGDIQSGVAWPTPRFIDNGNGTVTDNLTGLVWTKDGNAPGPAACSPANIKIWRIALDYVACLNTNTYLGYTDWRLPNINELRSLVNAGQFNTSIWLNTQGFNNAQDYGYWSSTSRSGSGIISSYKWIAYMGTGLVGFGHETVETYYVWPVRSGQ
jgi:hypothetical protein